MCFAISKIVATVTGCIAYAVKSSREESPGRPKESVEAHSSGGEGSGNTQSDTDQSTNNILRFAQVAIITSAEIFRKSTK
jgi:hypothetical protein